MRKQQKHKILSRTVCAVLSAAMASIGAFPAASSAGYGDYNQYKLDDSGFFGKDNEVWSSYSDATVRQCAILREIERDKFYVHMSDYDQYSAIELAGKLNEIFGAESSPEIKSEEHCVVFDPELGESEEELVDACYVTSEIIIHDPKLTYEEYLEACQLCEEYNKVINIMDYYFSAEKCHISPESLCYNEFFGVYNSQEEVDSVVKYIESLGREYSYSDYEKKPENGDSYYILSGIFKVEQTMKAEELFALAAKVKNDTGLSFSGGSLPSVELGYWDFEVTEADFYHEPSTYNDLAEITDEEVKELFPDFFMNDKYSLFGDESVDDTEKFKAALSPIEYEFYQDQLNGGGIPMRLALYDESVKKNITPAELGFPDDWDVMANAGSYLRNDDTDEYYYWYENAYYIETPDELLDFENYVRLLLAEENVTIFDRILLGCDAMLVGDVNTDGEVDIADAIYIMQSIANPDEYALSIYSYRLADVDGNAGITNADALQIQMFRLKLCNTLIPTEFKPDCNDRVLY